MEEIKIEIPTKELLEKIGVLQWPIWEKEISEFDWFYTESEQCLILEGEIEVKTEKNPIALNPVIL